MSFWRDLRDLINWLYGDEPYMEDQKQRLIKAYSGDKKVTGQQIFETYQQQKLVEPDSPDKIVVAAILRSFAENFEDWEADDLFATIKDYSHREFYDETYSLINRKTDVFITHTIDQVAFKLRHDYRHSGMSKEFWDNHPVFNDFRINDVPFKEEQRKEIIAGWRKIVAARAEAAKVAAKALQDMKENEQKWELAEKLLKMKRVNGALVPIEQPTKKAVIGAQGVYYVGNSGIEVTELTLENNPSSWLSLKGEAQW